MTDKHFPQVADDEIMLTQMPHMNLYDDGDFISNILGEYTDKNYLEWEPIATGKTVKRIEQAITDFVKTGVFSRIATSTYQVNAALFGKGDWQDIKNIRATFDFGKGTVETEIIKGEEEQPTDALQEKEAG